MNLHVHICPVCRKPVMVRDVFRENIVHKLAEDLVEYRYTRTVFDRAAGRAEVTEYLCFHRSCHEEVLRALQLVSTMAGRPILSEPFARVLHHERECLVIALGDVGMLIKLVQQASLAVLDKLTLEVSEETQRTYGGYKPLEELDPALRQVVEEAVRAMGYDPERYRVRVSRDLVDVGVVVVHFLLLLQGGLVRIVTPLQALLEQTRLLGREGIRIETQLKTII